MGFREAKGEYIFWLNIEMELRSCFLESMLIELIKTDRSIRRL